MNERLKELREGLGLSQAEFAKRLGLQRNSISLVENGKRNLSDRTISDICDSFYINEDWLRYGTLPMNRAVSYDEEVAMYTQDILDDMEGSVAAAIREFIVIYGKLDNTSKAVMNRVIDEMREAMNKKRDESS